MKGFFDIWHSFLLNDKAMAIFVVWCFGMAAFWKLDDPATIVSNCLSGLFGLVTGSALARADPKPPV